MFLHVCIYAATNKEYIYVHVIYRLYVFGWIMFEPYRCLFPESFTKDLKLLPFKQGNPPAAVRSSFPTCQSPLCPRAIPSLSGGGVDISCIAKPFSTPKLFIFSLSWHFNTPLCFLSDHLPKMRQKKKNLPSHSCQLEANRPNLRFDKT